MGLCASKSDKHEVTEAPKPTNARIKSIRGSTNKPDKPSLRNGSGHRVKGEVDENKDKLSAQDAARLAAERRLQESNAKETQGALGKKLAEERSRSHKTQMMKEVERRKLEKASNDNVYN